MNQPRLLGDKYILLDTLGVGGMAELFRGKLIRDKGFEKLIVVKKLLNHLTKDEKMVSHFIDEAKLAALLQHDNIVCTYDFGNIGKEYYIAMEHLSGKDLFTVMQKVQQFKKNIPVELALFITAKICDAMAYAHNLKDLHNQPLKLIHRDLTPHNIFLTYEGKVKVIDFGIAKNKLQENITQLGVVKGKVSYMSPEQVSGEEIDSRSDIFSIGILLYEMLSGEKLYTGNTAQQIQKAVNADFKPLEELTPGLPTELYEIVDKALQYDLSKRYQKCREMQADIEDYLFKLPDRVTAGSIKNFVHSIFAREFKKEQQKETQYTNQAVLYSKRKPPGLHNDITLEYKIYQQTQSAKLTRLFSKPVSSRILLISVLVIMVLVVGEVIFQFYSHKPQEDKDILVSVIEKTSPQPPTPKKLPKKSVLRISKTDKLKERIDNLLSKANESYSLGKFTGSANAAYGLYKNVLYLDEDNSMAKKGLERIANQLDTKIRIQVDTEQFSEAASAIKQLDGLFPKRLKTENLKTYYSAKKENKIKELFDKAAQALPSNRLTYPVENCALKYYNDIKAIDPNNPLIQQGYKKIADRYADLANAAFKNLHMKKARLYVHEGLLLDQTHPELLRLKDDLNRRGVVPYVKGVFKGIEDSDLF